MQALYIGISIAAFIAIIVVLILNRRKSHRISTLTMLGITMVVLGIIFSENRWVCYPLIGAGVLLAIIDATYVKRLEER
jgi:predicted branched-subunit amino acid permease